MYVLPFIAQITVSSGGMLLQKLNVLDPTLEQLEPFQGDVSYAQQKACIVSCLNTATISEH